MNIDELVKTIFSRKGAKDAKEKTLILINSVIYKDLVDFVIGGEGDPIRGCVTV